MDLTKGFYKIIAKILVWIMIVQGIPFWQLSQAYTFELNPDRLIKTVDFLTFGLLSPSSAQAGIPPDLNDYTANKIPNNFVDISGTGTQLNLVDDGGISGIPIGFNFKFYGTIFTTLTITSNGYLSFSPTISRYNTLIPSTDTPNALIAPFWDDLNPELNPLSGIFFETIGTSPNRQFIVGYKDVPLTADPDSRLTFEVVLFEGSNEIQYHYLSMMDGSGLSISPLVTGKSATIGIENAAGDKGSEVAFNTADSLTSGSAFSFTLAGTAFETGRFLGDLNNDGLVNIQDQYTLTKILLENVQPRKSLNLVLSDISPAPGTQGAPFGDQIINSDDHSRIFEAVMNRDILNPTLSISSFFIAAASESLTLFGSGFDLSAGNNSITFKSIDGTETSVPGESANSDGSELTVTIPAGIQHPSSIRVDRDVMMSNSLLFLLQGVPLITSITPDSGEEGDTITIRGYEFAETPGDNIVLFDGVSAVVQSVVNTTGLDTLVVTIPAGTASGPLTVSVNSQPSNEITFIYDGAPLVAITTPAADEAISGFVNIVGTASDLGLTSYTLEMGSYDSNTPVDYTVIASGTDSITDGILGSVDGSLMHNGFYRLRLTAEDTSGKISFIEREVVISGKNKAGVFSMSFTDLLVPVKGIPIKVTRKYDTRDRNENKDFGYGWTVEVGVEGSYSNNRKPGIGWSITSSSGLVPIPCSNANELVTHITEIRFSDTEFYRFAFVPGNIAALSSICEGYASYEQIGGTPGATLEIIGNNNWLRVGTELVDWDTLDTFEPDKVRLTTRDGREYDLDLQNGVERIADQNGNSISISDGGIVHSSGKSITFTRDGQNRITSITDPMGNPMAYVYDANGDLETYTDRAGNTTTFEYDAAFDHLLKNIIDPDSNAVVRNEYDDQGRLIAKVDAEGNRTEIDVDSENNQTTITDSEGQITIIQYDDDGNITDAGGKFEYTYDDHGNRLTETDALGNTRTFAYDPNTNDLLSETDALGNTITYTWNSNGNPVTATDADGNVTINGYDAEGRLVSITDANGVVSNEFAYDSSGNITQTKTLGGTWGMTYDTHGNATRIQGPNGRDLNFTYDANGNALTRTVSRTTDTGTVNETTTFTYDGNGRVTSSTDPLGNVTSFTYGGNGQILTRTDPLGNVTSFEYDARGNLVKAIFPDGTDELMGYDRENRLTGKTDRAGNSTLFEYDSKDRVVKTIFPDGSTTQNTYDTAGLFESFTNQNGSIFSFAYNAARRVTELTGPLGNKTLFTYHATGARATQTDPMGNTTLFSYDDSAFNTPRLNTTTFADGSTVSQTYGINGRVATKTDELGHVKTYDYDAAGNLVKVTDALGNETTYTYDEVGNRIEEIDANGNMTSFSYDANKRLIKRTLPLGQEETFTYDAAGNMITQTDFNGDTITFEYDSMHRMIKKTMPGPDIETYTYTPTGKLNTITRGGRVSDYDYDVMGRVVSISHNDGTFLNYTWDDAGNRTSVETISGLTTYTYDALNRLRTVMDPDGNVARYTYDSVGYVVETELPNGTKIEYTYDSRHRPISVKHLTGTTVIGQYDYVLDAAGRRTQMSDNFGRVVDYTYDALGRIISENEGTAVTYTYDNVGNRLTKGGAPYTYDNNNRMLTADSGATLFTYDDNGNRLTRIDGSGTANYTYDSLNRLIQYAAPDSTFSMMDYDTFGNRIKKDVAGVETNFLVDPFDNSGHAQVIEERDDTLAVNPTTSIVASYIYGNDLMKMDRNGSVNYFHSDALGSTRLLTNAGGSVSDTYNYDAFGNQTAGTGTTMNAFRFAGEQFDPASSLYYLRARYMDPVTGTFISTDPYPGNIFSPQTLHKYMYADNNPVNMIDPTGQFSLAGTMMAVSIVSILTTIAISSFLVYKEVSDIYDKLDKLINEIPQMKLNKDHTRDDYDNKARIWKAIWERDLSNNLGGGALGEAYDISADLVGGTAGQAVAFIWSLSAAQWMATLPTVKDPSDGNKMKPGFYLSCGFNQYVASTYALQLANGVVTGKVWKTAAMIIGLWLNYFNFLALLIDTMDDASYGVPPQPNPPRCW